jgi:tripartite ATP-independent transporter DctM subunit
VSEPLVEKLNAAGPYSIHARHGRGLGLLIALSDTLDWLLTALAALLLASLVAVMFVGVIYRYVLNNALPWTEEVAGFEMGWLVFIGAAVVYRRAGHPAITVLTSRLGRGMHVVVNGLAETVVGTYFIVLLGAGVALLFERQPHSPALSLPYTIPYLSISVAGVVMLVHWLRDLISKHSARSCLVVAVAVALCGSTLVTAMESTVTWFETIPLGLLWLIVPVAFALGVPIAMVLGIFSATFLAFSGGIPLSIIAQRAYAGIDNPAFLAIPAFMLTGSLMLVTGMSESLVGFASALVGQIRGGLALADVVASVLFADISGSAVADTAAIGTALMPGMVRRGYDRHFVAAHQAAAGSLGTLFPPSISMIIFATVTSVSVTGLFLSSMLPGILVALTYMVIAYLIARRNGYPREPATSLVEKLRTTVKALPALVAPVVVLGGILLGVFTPYEAGAVAAIYVAVVGLVLRPRSLLNYGKALVEGAKTSAMVMFIIANASVLAWVMIGQQIPQQVAGFVGGLTSQPVPILLMLCALLIGLSIFLEPPAILIAVVPILLPIVTGAGVPALQFGVIVMVTTAIGMLLPPIGITLLVSVAIIESSIERAARAAIPYVLAATIDLVLVIVFPQLTAWLPAFIQSLH